MRPVASSEASDSSFMVDDDVLAAAMATIVRVQPKDFRAVKREWAAIRIQTAFRGLLVYGFLLSLWLIRFFFPYMHNFSFCYKF